MFEQSLTETKRPRSAALTLSLAAQITLIGSALLVPLIWTQRLQLELTVPHYTLPSPKITDFVKIVAVERVARESFATSPALSAPVVNARPSFTIRPLSEVMAGGGPTTLLDAPALSNADGIAVPGWIGDSSPTRGLPVPQVKASLPKSVPPPAEKPRTPMRVSEGVQQAKLIKQVMPVYPALAKQARVAGTVRLLAVISRDGTIQDLKLMAGHPLLVQAAIDAVKQWTYRPTMLNNEPVEVITTIEVNFRLSQ
jgi:protein TonB